VDTVISLQKVSKCVKELDECGSGRASRVKNELILEHEGGIRVGKDWT